MPGRQLSVRNIAQSNKVYHSVNRLYSQRHIAIRSIAPKLRIVKNLLVFSISNAMVYGSFAALRNHFLTSEFVGIAGPISFSLLQTVSALSCFYGVVLARKLTYKLTFVLTYLPYLLYIGAMAFTRDMTVYPVMVALGLVQGPMWNAAVAYVIKLSAQFSYFFLYKTKEKTALRFLTVFNTVLSCGYMLGHLFAAIAFSAAEFMMGNYSATAQLANVHIDVDHRSSKCGAWFCSGESDLKFPDTFRANLTWSDEFSGIVPVYTLTLYAGNIIAAPFLSFFLLDKLTVQLCTVATKPITAGQQFANLMQIFQDRQLQAVFPILIYIGLGESFVSCDFIKTYVRCTSPVSVVGYVLFCYGCVSTLFYGSLGTVLRHIRRLTVLMAAILFQLGSLSIMWMWKPVSDDKPILYVIAASWAMSDTILKVMAQTVIYKIFPESWESPFAVYFMLTSIGSAAGYAICPYTCIEYKIYMLGGILFVALLPYTLLEYRIQQQEEAMNNANEYIL